MPMKRWTVIILILSFILTGRASAVDPDSKNIRVLTSFYPMYIMALNVCRDVPGVTVSNLTPPLTGCLHDYSLTTDAMKKLEHADIFVANGAGMESFLKRVAAQYPSIKIVELAKDIPLIKGEGNEGNNPHVWVSISYAIIEVENLGRAMESFDPGHAGLYRKNTAAYIARLDALRSRMRSELAPFKGRRIITFHEAFPYFAGEFGLKIAAVVEREPGSQPSAKELADTIDLIRKSGIRSIFIEPQYPAMAAKTIAGETGAEVYVLDPAVTAPDDPDAYLDIMEQNLAVLRKALS
jgi:zinc transport system substrate-binding protein